MKKLFKYICVPLILINNNVYTFISGILLSLSTGMITTLCYEKTDYFDSWHLYCSSFNYIIAGALFIYVASQITSYQNYISSKQIVEKTAQQSIINDFEAHRSSFWVIIFCCLFFTLVSGTVFLFLNYII